MLKPSINEILNQIDNRYYLIGTVAKRAREIIEGEELLTEAMIDPNKPVCVASQEIIEGKVGYRKLSNEEVIEIEKEKKIQRMMFKKED